MAIDQLQEKIRNLKNPSMIHFQARKEWIPFHILCDCGSIPEAYRKFAEMLLNGLQNIVPAVRFNYSSFSLWGGAGLDVLSYLMKLASSLGFYVAMDSIQVISRPEAETAAEEFLSPDCSWPFDGLIVSAYIGSDGIQPYITRAQKLDKDLFVVCRTGNRSAGEIQDLLTGTRVVHMAAAEIAERLGGSLLQGCGFSSVGIVGCAVSADSLKILRELHKNMFILVGGYDYSNANGKICSNAFDQFGHGAVVCAGSAITCAWKENQTDEEFVQDTLAAVQRMRKNILRYITLM